MTEKKVYPFRSEWDRARYSPPWLCLCVSEANVEKTILHSLLVRGIQAVKVDTGSKSLRGRAVGLAKRLGGSKADLAKMNLGATSAGIAGLADIVGVLPGGRALFVEVKAPEWLELSAKSGKLVQKRKAGHPEPEQLEFLERMRRQGAVVGIAWSPADLDEILRRA